VWLHNLFTEFHDHNILCKCNFILCKGTIWKTAAFDCLKWKFDNGVTKLIQTATFLQQCVIYSAYVVVCRFGSLQSVRVLPDKYCAFVNFVSKECAGRAMQGLQVASDTLLYWLLLTYWFQWCCQRTLLQPGHHTLSLYLLSVSISRLALKVISLKLSLTLVGLGGVMVILRYLRCLADCLCWLGLCDAREYLVWTSC